MPIVNDPAVCAEIAALHDAYEAALVANDVDALGGYFWSSPEVVRFGVSEHLYGSDEIAAYRQNNRSTATDRKLLRRTIVTLGTETASVMCEISQNFAGVPRHTRQSQVWARFPEVGWKIIAAHVSNAVAAPAASWGAYVEQASVAVGLPIPAEYRAGVAGQLSRTAQIAAPLLNFPLPVTVEPAAVFTA